MPLHRLTTTWRDWYNPLKGLSMSRIVAMEDAAERGQHADLQWLWNAMERTDVTVQAAIARRLSFIDSIDWEIRASESADPMLAAEQTELLTYAYNRIANFKEATKFLASALFRGFAHLEKIDAGYGGLVSRLDPVPQWHWVRDGANGRWRFNPESKSHESRGEIVSRHDLCVMEAQALDRAIARHFFAKQLAFADWDQALELGANQSIFFIGPPGTSEEKELEYRNVAEQMASNGRGYLPNGADVKIVDPASRSKLPFYERIRYCDEQIVMAATGGLLTMLTQPGSGTLAGGAHAEGLLALARSDAARLSEVYQRDLDRHWLAEFFPRQPHAAYFAFDVPQKEDLASMLESVANLNWAGYRVDQKQLEEKTGLKLIPLPQEPMQ
jgi:phage gp29-like protein